VSASDAQATNAYWGRSDLERAIGRLPSEQREVLLLREVEDMSYAEIAATLGIGEGTVKSRLARARVAALAHYRGHAGENSDE